MAKNEGNPRAVNKARPLPEKERDSGNDCPTWRSRGAQNSLPSYFDGYNWPLPNNAARKQVSPYFYWSPGKVCWGVSHPLCTAEICTGVYSSQIVARHGSGSTLITDQGREFMSSFFQRTCKILGVCRLPTSSNHASPNWMVERLHRSLHSGLSYYVNANHKNWDELVSFYLNVISSHPSHDHGLQSILFVA